MPRLQCQAQFVYWLLYAVFHSLATQDVEILLIKLTVGGITQTKTKTGISTQNAHLALALFFREPSMYGYVGMLERTLHVS